MSYNYNLIPLPSGTIINLAHVAFIRPGHAGEVTIVFAAGGAPNLTRLDLNAEDATSFVELAAEHTDVVALQQAMEKEAAKAKKARGDG